jgi:O-antigen ligase
MRPPTVVEIDAVEFEYASAREPLYGRFDSVLLHGLYAVLMFGVLAAGATQPWSQLTIQISAVILVCIWVAQQLSARTPAIAWNILWLPTLLMGSLIVLQAARFSKYPEVTREQALMYAAFAMLMFVSTQVFSRTSRMSRLLRMMSQFGFVLAVFGIASVVAGNGKLYWVHELKFQGGWIVGPYVNHNHFAGIMEMLVPFPLLATMARNRRHESRVLYGFTALLMIAAVLLSRSRGGTVALACELFFAVVVLTYRWHARRHALAILSVVAGSLGFLWWLGSEQVVERLGNLMEPIRLAISRDSLAMFRAHPWAGWGLGVFPIAYPRFQSFYSSYFINAAHNDYAQLLVETGLIGVGLILWFLLALYRSCLRQIGDEPSESRLVRLAALTGITGLLIHSWFDFNLQISANAALFYVLCTIAAQDRDAVRKLEYAPASPGD